MTVYPKQPPEQVRSVVVLFSFLYRFQIGKKYWFQLEPGEHNLRLKYSWTDLRVYTRKYGEASSEWAWTHSYPIITPPQ